VVLWFAALTAPWLAVAVFMRDHARWAALAVAALLATWVGLQRRRLLSKAVAVRPEEHPRLVNLATGLARDLDVDPPRLFLSTERGPNAFVVPGAIVVTEDLLDTFTRTELEAVVAHCLVRLRDGGLRWAVATAATRGVPDAAPRVDRHVDARAAAVTRYPPALASAIRKAAPARGPAAPLWFVADSPSHIPADERVDQLLDL
jgi:hypothetical protein